MSKENETYDVSSLLEVTLSDDEAFLKIKETLTRIGIPTVIKNDGSKRILTQTCHILHKKGRYYIVHFKELIGLDGNETTFSDEDRMRRNRIAKLLEEWGLLKIVVKLPLEVIPMSKIKIVPFKEASGWILKSKYNIGRKTN